MNISMVMVYLLQLTEFLTKANGVILFPKVKECCCFRIVIQSKVVGSKEQHMEV